MRANKEKLNHYFNSQLKKLLRTYEGYRYDADLKLHWIDTRFGRLKICENELSEDIDNAFISLHMMFRDKFKSFPNYEEFQTLPNINPYSGKWNFYYQFPRGKEGVIEILKRVAMNLDMVAEPIDMVEVVKSYGFSMVSDKTPIPIEGVEEVSFKKILFIKRIHDLIWLQYDILDGFVTLFRERENKVEPHKVILPKPIRSEADLKLLLDAIC